MVDKLDKKNWYDGWIYAKIIDTQPIPFRYKIFNYLKSNHSVLDIGCGTGAFTAEIARKCKRVTGVDISQTQIDLARKNIPTGRFLHGDAASVQFPAASFDAVISFYALEHIPREEHETLLLRLWRVAGGGKPVWRARLKSAHTGEEMGFGSLEELFDFLRRQTELPADGDGN